MRKNRLIAPLAALLCAAPTFAQDDPPQEYPSPNAIVAAAAATEWQAIAPSDLLVMDLAPDGNGEQRRVIIQLMPPPFSQAWIRNIRKLAAAKFWDGTSINRVQDNYVVQWGDAGYDNPESGGIEQKALPEGLEMIAERPDPDDEDVTAYTVPEHVLDPKKAGLESAAYLQHLKNIWWGTKIGLSPHSEFYGEDSYADWTDFRGGWPVTFNFDDTAYVPHCYGMVGVGRNLSPDTGTGAELYTVIGHAPRHLDRNIAVVGRIIEGMEHLSSLPRGKGQLGFYADPKKRVPIQSIRIATALPADEQPAFQYLDTASTSFARYADARANRRDPFFIKPAGGADICNIPVPVRRVKAE